MCAPNTLGTYTQLTAAMVLAVQEAALEDLTSPTEAYSCDLHVLELVDDSLSVTCMTTNDCQQGQLTGPQVIVRMQDGTLG